MGSLIEVTVAADEVDLASGLLWAAGVSAVAEQPAAATDRVVLVVDVPPGGPGAVRAALDDRWPMRRREVLDDGLDGWRPWATAVRVADRLVVRPPWIASATRPGDIEVVIDPGRVFGHGAHATTRLVLAALLRSVTPGCSVLDVGCGSGVLAVAAARLGAARVVAVDVDADAVSVTIANAAANHVADRVSASSTPVAALDDRFEVVVANIGAATLVSLAASLAPRVAPDGVLVLSGLLAGQDESVRAAYADLLLTDRTEDDVWSALILRR